MAPRLDLQAILVELVGSDAVYFQPPPNIQMSYPCIVYRRDNIFKKFADNDWYVFKKRYQLTVIDRDPDGALADTVAKLPACSFDRFFTADNLNHDVFSLFF
jgi:hypothetical protein